jgi:hypothetical protein
MKIMDQAREKAATGYILLWLPGIPIPIPLLIFRCAVARKRGLEWTLFGGRQEFRHILLAFEVRSLCTAMHFRAPR